ncbi:hypothetical protein BT69DRAFT_1334120 [Atractiella rhizophila]|nr:hypothetical protein BT69DRAFT_1334120 [Atractiella rhizophila]
MSTATRPRTLGRYEACTNCHKRKIRCDGGRPCGPCSKPPRHRKGEAVKPRICSYDDVAVPSSSSQPSFNAAIDVLPPQQLHNSPLSSAYPSSRPRPSNGRGEDGRRLDEPFSGPSFASISRNDIHLSPQNYSPESIIAIDPSLSTENDVEMEVAEDDVSLLLMRERISFLEGTLTSLQKHNATPDTAAGANFCISERASRPYCFPFLPLKFQDSARQTRFPSSLASPAPSPDSDAQALSDGGGWPTELPRRDLVVSFIETMLKQSHLAAAMLNVPKFMSHLSLPPKHADFPTLAILHASCALGQILCPMERLQYMLISERKYWEPFESPYEYHFMRAKRAIMEFKLDIAPHYAEKGDVKERRALQLAQAAIVTTLYCYTGGAWMDTWNLPGVALRICISLGLNRIDRLPKSKTSRLDEEEMHQRLFTFWLSFTMERTSSMMSGWAPSLSISDISSPLPFPTKVKCRMSAEDMAAALLPSSKRFASFNPTDIVTPSLLVFKAVWLASKVTTFLARVESWEAANDEDVIDNARVRTHPEFLKLDRTLREFRRNFPEPWKDLTLGRAESIREQTLHARQNLIIAHILAHGGILSLHAPFFSMDPDDFSMARSLESAQAILSMLWIYKDDFVDKFIIPNAFVSFIWGLVGRTLIRDMEVRRLSGEDVFARRMEARYIVDLLVASSEKYPKLAIMAIPLSRLLENPSNCIPPGWTTSTKVVQTPNQLHSDLKKPRHGNPQDLV